MHKTYHEFILTRNCVRFGIEATKEEDFTHDQITSEFQEIMSIDPNTAMAKKILLDA
jgi:hypothetical protein